MSRPARPELAVLLELRSLLGELTALAGEGDRARYDGDARYRWVVQRLWIAVGNEAAAVMETAGPRAEPWRSLYLLRNLLAHRRLPDIDEDTVWRTTVVRLPALATSVGLLLGADPQDPDV